MRYSIYRLPLPSGGVARVRKLDRLALLSHGLICFPLLGAAVTAASTEDDRAPDTLRHVLKLCRAALVDPEVDPEDLPLADRMAVYHWANTPAAIEPAVLDCEAPWLVSDFRELASGSAAITIDMLCRRYAIRPSILIGIDDGEIAMDVDLALAYRGIIHESAAQRGESEIEVEDVMGNTHRVPANWFEAPDPAAKVTHADEYARRAQRMGVRELALSAGGAMGASSLNEAFGEMRRFRQ